MVGIQPIWRAGLTIVLGGVLSIANAQGIFKCVDGESTAYQSMPCAKGQTETRLLTVGRATPSEVEDPALPRVDRLAQSTGVCGRAWPCRRTLMLGMSDDEVLNLPGWGVPQRIARERKAHEWREEWTYGSRVNSERRLHFVNATLVDVTEVPSTTQVASLASP